MVLSVCLFLYPRFLDMRSLKQQVPHTFQQSMSSESTPVLLCAISMLRSKGLKDATCVGWFGDDWDCSVGFPPEAIDHMSSSVPIGYAV